jgi:hypothetical protein
MQGDPCLEQVGYGPDSNSDGKQDEHPVYGWNNSYNVGQVMISINDIEGCTNPSVADHIAGGRHYYNCDSGQVSRGTGCDACNYNSYTYSSSVERARANSPEETADN